MGYVHYWSRLRIRVTSDGTSREWNDARDACQHILGYGIDWGEDKLAPAAAAVPPPPPPPPTAS